MIFTGSLFLTLFKIGCLGGAALQGSIILKTSASNVYNCDFPENSHILTQLHLEALKYGLDYYKLTTSDNLLAVVTFKCHSHLGK